MIVPFEIYAIEIKVLTNNLIYSIKKCIQHKCFQVNIYVLNLSIVRFINNKVIFRTNASISYETIVYYTRISEACAKDGNSIVKLNAKPKIIDRKCFFFFIKIYLLI